MISFAHWIFGAALVPVAVSWAIIATARIAERARPASKCPTGSVLFNLFYLVPYSLLHAISAPAVAIVAVAITNVLGGGFVRLPSSGWGLVPAVALYALTMDFGEYVFHRAQHRFPVLWAMHSLHHSDLSVNVSTTPRHFWAEQAIKSATIYIIVGLLFRANDRILVIYGALTFWNFVSHMNLRLGFGPAWFIVNSPQFHRVHHSCRREHYDRNFAALFTIFDALFRTAHVPAPEEYPSTGLEDEDTPRSLTEAVLWPMRGWLRREHAHWPAEHRRNDGRLRRSHFCPASSAAADKLAGDVGPLSG
jgi:sterol desaturase/sphingolipid hydroxylase (fatty acid hydroxylase superfamily)